MNLLKSSLANPIAVFVAVLLALIFGGMSLERLPVQLTPEVESPEISITTNWRAAAPEEVESEILEPQEKVFRGLPGMTDILSEASRGQGKITISFIVGMDMQRALLEVLNRLNRVPFYPEDADEPVISSVGGDSRAIAWFIIKPTEGNQRHIASYQNYIEDVVQARLERVPGVALSEVRGGRETEIRITFDPYKAAALNIQLPRVAALAGNNKDISAGTTDVGKRRYTVRFTGKYSVDQLSKMVLEWRDGRPITLGDVANVDAKLVDRSGFVIQNGEAAMAVNAHRETGVNVIEVMDGLKAAIVELRDGQLKREKLSIQQVYDETLYIDRSIELVISNLMLGVVLAIGILWWFLRRFRATLMVAIAIPVSIITSFILLDVFDRTLNVISLAGLAFAVGMVLDAAIVVLENISRLKEHGESSYNAAFKGTKQVWGALFASSITTVAIFLPIVFLKDESGQLFADLALTIAVAITFSLITAVIVLPTVAKKWFGDKVIVDPHEKWWDATTKFVMTITNTSVKRIIWITSLMSLSVILIWQFMPTKDYLPPGNRNLVFAFIFPPPGINIDTMEQEMGMPLAEYLQPFVDGDKQPVIDNYFFVTFPRGAFLGMRAKDPTQTEQLEPLMNRIINSFPDTFGFASRASLFGRMGSGNSIEFNIRGQNLENLIAAAQLGYREINQVLPGSRIRPRPGLDLGDPELQVIPDERAIAEAGWDRSTVSSVMRALGDGLFLGDYFDGDRRMDVILRSEKWVLPEELASIPLATPNSGVVSLGELVDIVRTAGPEQIRRTDRRRTITLEVTPPKGMSMEQAISVLREKVEPKVLEIIPTGGDVQYAGTAEKLGVALQSMLGSFVLAIVILFLLMAALFQSFKDSLLVLFTIPLATVGGILGLHFMGLTMDLLTMIGFIILLGLVVNNAILLVHQTRTAEREGIARSQAVEQAVRLRLRPILMSTLTSIFGMLPLVLISFKNNFPWVQETAWFNALPDFIRVAAGAELYAGLAVVIVGGMLVSTLFTLVLLPSLLRIGEGKIPPVKEENKLEMS